MLDDGTAIQIPSGYEYCVADIIEYDKIGDCHNRFCWCIRNGLDPFKIDTVYNRALTRAKKHIESYSSNYCLDKQCHINDNTWQEWDADLVSKIIDIS